MLIDRLELTNFVGIISPARGALIVEVPSNVIPAKSANLWRDIAFIQLEYIREGVGELRHSGIHLVLALAGLEVQIRDVHLLKAERALLCFLHRKNDGID